MLVKRIAFIVLYILTILIAPVSLISKVSAHRSGCHRWHSCPSDTGSYVCGDLGYTSDCPTTNNIAPIVSAPRTPVISTKNLTSEEAINFTSNTEYDSREYSGYSKVKQVGENGKSEVTTPITYTDGKETSRGISIKSTKLEPKPKITILGTRLKPMATISSVSNSKKKDKFDISGTYNANSEVVLSVNGKKIKRAKTNSSGKFTFTAIRITKNDNELKIYKRENRKENQVSELTYFMLSSKQIKTEFQKLHEK